MMRALACATLLAAAAACAHAHDSWLVRQGAGWQVVTGTRYPRADLIAAPESIARQDCSEDASACWAELREYEIELDPKLVDVYFRDAQPSREVRERWQTLHAQGKPWHERYRKFMRVDLAAARAPTGMDLELLPVGNAAFRSGAIARFVLLSGKQPVENQPVELVSERSPLGLWSRTNDQGEVQWPLPFAGQWMVRTILIELDGEDRFKSRFATLVFDAR